MWWYALGGFALGCWLSYAFIFPSEILSIKLTSLTIGDILRILGGIAAIFVLTEIGHILDIGAGNAD